MAAAVGACAGVVADDLDLRGTSLSSLVVTPPSEPQRVLGDLPRDAWGEQGALVLLCQKSPLAQVNDELTRLLSATENAGLTGQVSVVGIVWGGDQDDALGGADNVEASLYRSTDPLCAQLLGRGGEEQALYKPGVGLPLSLRHISEPKC